jgi:CheY-like chemotaxis protein
MHAGEIAATEDRMPVEPVDELLVARYVRAAIELAERARPDLVLLDLDMPAAAAFAPPPGSRAPRAGLDSRAVTNLLLSAS